MCLQEPSMSFCGILNELTGEHFWALLSQLRGTECVRSTPLHLFSCHVRSCSPQGNTPITVKTCMLHTTKNICLQVPSEGAGIAQWLERRTRDWKVAGSNPCWNGGRIFFSRVDFLCWLLFRYPFHPRVTAVARKISRSFCQKVQVAGYS